jgi:glutamate-1-semialdehyde aminotransferase
MADTTVLDFAAQLSERTRGSKDSRSRFGPSLADSRATAGYRPVLDPIVYPILGQRAEGARIWDVDGNEYIDFTMGFGVHFFGHNPAFVLDALHAHAGLGFCLGPQATLAGEVAERIGHLTGMARLCFCNSGTEAVMMAIRLARAVTGRSKIALFWGSYHGQYDVTLARPRRMAGGPQPSIGAPGVTDGAVGDSLVLPYGAPESLETLESLADTLAAVLVEPVQSRNLSLQPAQFLQDLRTLTAQRGITLIFDDVLLGFRIHRQGSQGWFDVKADIATYGKMIGGGMPIGIVAGGKQYLDAIDGGFFPFGDVESPRAKRTFFAGTFNKHPLTMALAQCVLEQLESGGAKLQSRLNDRCTALANRLNAYFQEQDVPIAVENFASVFRFKLAANLDTFFYYLLYHGVYVWEGRTCFLSLAHSDEDLEEAFSKVKSSIDHMRADAVL